MRNVTTVVRRAVRRCGFDIVRYVKPPLRLLPTLPDLTNDEARIVAQVAPFTLTSPERIAAVIYAVKYILRYRIEGEIVECGVWRGGSMMAIALALIASGDTSRELFLYDTFEGFNAPTDHDVNINEWSARSMKGALVGPGTYYAVSLEEVRESIYSTGYPRERLHFIKGKVEDTIPGSGPSRIALLRLDTDWYESTKHELRHLYPAVDRHGVVIIDDYGEWKGARRAVDEYLATLSERVFLHRIDYTGRIIVRCADG